MTELPAEKKLSVLFRLEPGCLGPEGAELIEGFCNFANSNINELPYASYQFVPRFDKNLPEWEYKINSRNLNNDRVSSYLAIFGQVKNQFEESLEEQVTEYIEIYLDRT
ncbi:hypothetical protein [Pseudoalteromonas denitrificans]|uniref:Uncharacterized protein n=1 Tax=Pseudoalteromonas denitrificans DSM 6059 TaxID=1123010 RepID=A0A1I1HYG0_9GAMM|nr:hypothetical protein [Pseudoalteromonas denitrificans]SFC29199.1 hypothetical protein SAMN02745724_01314 [Pseudoalteromonas denitrificans DSM 6059]